MVQPLLGPVEVLQMFQRIEGLQDPLRHLPVQVRAHEMQDHLSLLGALLRSRIHAPLQVLLHHGRGVRHFHFRRWLANSVPTRLRLAASVLHS